ncbi:hypothetical protein RND81_05G085800 [Saponaria officinalis]|uniref:Protein SHORTAGE IN CHIASMATA 1 n=1 Tax=Saponaria officinalis TaxID=3572 RepID=A0AAW1KTP5_SAPOF
MRTKFLTPNYFTSTSQTLDFLRLPLSPLPSATAVDATDDLLRSAVDFLSSAVSLDLQNLPFDDALSKFYSDVLPHTIDVDHGGFLIDLGFSSDVVQVQEERANLCYMENIAQNGLTSHFDSLDNQFFEERKEDTGGDKIKNEPVVQFEIPELSQYEEFAGMSEKENILFLSEVQSRDDNLEKLDLVPVDQLDFVSKDLVNSVETICLEYDIAQKLQIPDDVDLLPKHCHHSDTVFPLFEVDETDSTDFMRFCAEHEWHSLLVTMGEHHSVYHDDQDLSCQILLISEKIDILDLVSDCHSSKVPPDMSLTSLDLTVNADCLQLIEAPKSETNIGGEGPIPVPLLVTLQFEEFEMLDLDSFDIFESLAISQTVKELETCDQLFDINQHFKSFDELIVSSELAIIDGTFTSLPVPVLVDDEKIWSVEIIADVLLAELEQLPFSTSDEIYLDWHLLGTDKCSSNVDAAIEKVFNDVEDYKINTNLESSDCGILVLDFLLSEYPSDKLNTREDKLDMPSGGSCTEEQRVDDTVRKRLLDDDCQFMGSKVKILKPGIVKVAFSSLSDDIDCQIIENHQLPRHGDLGEVASSFESVPQVNDLDFFLNPRKAAVDMRTHQRLKPPFAKFTLSGGLHEKAVAAAIPSGSIHEQQFNIQSHKVMLSSDILILIDHLQRSYLTMIREDMQLSMTEFGVADSVDINLLRLPEQMLMDYLSRSVGHKSHMGQKDANAVIFALCAIKRMAWCLCFYGIYNLHLFLCKLFQKLVFLKPKLISLYSLIEDANSVVNEEITKSHPSLPIIKDILLHNNIRRGKILIIAQQDFWGPLKRLLNSMNISITEVDLLTSGHQTDRRYDLFTGGLKDHAVTVCMLVEQKHISPPILMQKFELIVECGGSCGVSKISTLYWEHIGLQNFHFVNIELDDVARALCEGVIVASGDTHTNLDGLLKFGPLAESSNNVFAEAPAGRDCDSLAVPVCRTVLESESCSAYDPSFPDMIIVVNTENFDKEMIISRRGTYQRILGMEKRGVQVVERDLMLPIDIILDTVTCIVWYDCKNIGKKATAEDEGSSSVPLCIENIATNVLTSLSFTFTACVLVFEGDSNFLGTVMESADELYAAAASLGTNIQIFCSYSSELTDEIILNYIGQAKKFCRGSLPRLPETETHAESFLTKIPSINPLSAHAIISCGCMLLKYLEWSSDCRIHALRRYNLPEESVNLLSVLFKFGEREESKSGLTDCSSSVSSPPDKEKNVYKVNSVDRKRKLITNSSDAMHEFKCSTGSDEHVVDGMSYIEGLSGPRASKSPRVSLLKKLPDFFLDGQLFDDKARPGSASNMDHCKEWPGSNVPVTVNVPQLRDDFAKSTFTLNDGFGEQTSSWVNEFKREGCMTDTPQDLREDFVGEVFDSYDKSPFDMDFQVSERAVKSSLNNGEAVEDRAHRSSKAGRKLSFDDSSYFDFPLADDFNTSSMLEDNRQLRDDNDYNGVDYNWDSNGFNPQQEPTGTGLFEKSMKNFRSPLSKEKFVPSHGETPLSRAVQSAQLQQGSPWTIEFLNRIKEKRRMRQQNQPWETSVPHSSNHGNIASVPQSSNHGNISKETKRRSPSILEYYKYQGGSRDGTPRKLTPQKLQKQQGQLSNEKPSGLRRTWTPIDKRARRSLSFATGGAGGQTKLIWNDNISCSQGSRLSK